MKIVPFLFVAAAMMPGAFAVTAKSPEAPKPPCCREGLPPGKYSEKSLYTLDATWTSDVGREIKLEKLRGRPQVVALFFTNCEHSCPLIVADMKRIEKDLPMSVRGKVDFLLVSIDPARDTPEALHAFREKHKLATERWTLLRGNPDAVKKLAGMLGFNYYPGSNTQFAHSLLVTIIDAAGDIAFQQSGITPDRMDAVDTLVKLVTGKAKR
jgi:protein SCO1/2